MDRDELLRRIDAAQQAAGDRGSRHSDRAISLGAGLGADFIRDLRRNKNSSPAAAKLLALARALGVPARHLIEDEVSVMAPPPDGHLDRERLRLALLAADRAISGENVQDASLLRADIASAVYDVLTERAAAGESLDEASALRLIDGLIRRLVASRLR